MQQNPTCNQYMATRPGPYLTTVWTERTSGLNDTGVCVLQFYAQLDAVTCNDGHQDEVNVKYLLLPVLRGLCIATYWTHTPL